MFVILCRTDGHGQLHVDIYRAFQRWRCMIRCSVIAGRCPMRQSLIH